MTSDDKKSSELMELVEWQVAFGPRLPGTRAHREFIAALADRIEPTADELYMQDFSIFFQGKDTECTNIIAVKKADGTPKHGPLLLGTHFDTRLTGDNETDPALRNIPIPGANDGGSGTAILIHLLRSISSVKFDRDVHFVFFDAEDVGNIDKFEFSIGARYLADHPIPRAPDFVFILDMVGGKEPVYDIDAHLLAEPHLGFTRGIVALAHETGFTALLQDKPAKCKYIVCDHSPFILKQIPSFILIDIDYPQWHTQRDLPEAMSGYSLSRVENFVLAFLDRFSVKKNNRQVQR
jgi:glutaminyl-peptide cyclotransferase